MGLTQHRQTLKVIAFTRDDASVTRVKITNANDNFAPVANEALAA